MKSVFHIRRSKFTEGKTVKNNQFNLFLLLSDNNIA